MYGMALAVLSFALLVVTSSGAASQRPWIEQISWRPRAYLYHNFLSEAEADHVVTLAKPHITRSSVLNDDDSVSDAHEVRTSYGTFLRSAQDEVISGIEERVSRWVHLPVSHMEDMQVLKYVDGQKYDAHWDERAAEDGTPVGGGSRRICTVLMYLSDVEYGGETAFPGGFWLDAAVQNRTEFSACAAKGPAALARKGDAIMFWDMKPDGVTLDRYSLHTGCPVLAGEKWSSTFWIHDNPFRRSPGSLLADIDSAPAPACEDQSTTCATLLAGREGAPCLEDQAARCRRSCGRCCQAGDVLCERRAKRIVAN
ncbi:hypothetical protein APUTEX25_001638 [Auxenochlorella protothecoides]|uniref:Fe2OG dioxygenase domain-containing protein n=2 Tax=Auxenochlorella protothecoides TaxID=3075 RepID=A0A1D1ZP28_AUXPR|nr:hypothetical protein APUTEX25_001638 [Auxenochlorella protothecoides]|eukprot:RMZ52248.1 hypothetical protein APUTEX25_001638 [Auxenochlorella protothecoides]